jgi:hypothetical protein
LSYSFLEGKGAEHTDCGTRSALIHLVDELSFRVGGQADAADQPAPRRSPTFSAIAIFGPRRVGSKTNLALIIVNAIATASTYHPYLFGASIVYAPHAK